jgi:hypothetical protein
MTTTRTSKAKSPTTSRGARLTAGLALSLALTLTGVLGSFGVLAASASAATPVALDAPENGESPLIAYDPSTRTTYVAWSNPQGPGVDLCVLPTGATGCSGGAPVLLTDTSYPGYASGNAPALGGLVVLPNGEAVVIGTPVSEGSVAWASPAGGAAFLSGGQGLQNGGKFVSHVSLFYAFGNATALSDSDVALLDDYGNYFGDTPLSTSDPAIPAPNSNQTTPAGEFARKSLETAGPEVAAEQAPAPAPAGTDIVVGVGDNYGGPQGTLPGCLNKEGSGYGVAVGTVAGASNAAGTLNGRGLPGYGVLACSALAPVLASGGQDGIGVVEEEGNGIDGAGSAWTIGYRPFDATASGGTFGAPVELTEVTHVALDGVDALDLSEDSATGVYATWQDEQGLVLDYSPNGGASWEGPVVVPPPASGAVSDPVLVGVSGGDAEIAYRNNPGTGPQVFLEAVNYQQLAVHPASIAASGTSTSTTVTVTISCASTPCTVTITITIPGASGAAARYARKTKAITLGTGKFTIPSKGAKKLTVRLSKAGRKYLASRHGRLSAEVAIAEKTAGGTALTTRTIKITPAKH